MEVIERPNLIWHPHPILPSADRQELTCILKPGSTIREVLIASGIDTKQPIIISLDDKLLTISEWDLICPRSGQLINVHATVMGGGGGGGGGSNPIQIVALIAIVVLSVYTAGAVGAVYGAAWGAAAGAAVSIAGSMIVNAVFAASTPSTSLGNASGQNIQTSPTYGLSGGSNRSRPYESMPVIMGQHRFFPDLAAKPFVEYQGEDQYLYQIFHLGLSSCVLSNWMIGTNPITNYQDYSWSYPNSSGQITTFPGNVDSVSGAEVVNSAGWITRTTSTNTYRIGLDIEGTFYYANTAGGLDATSVQLRIQYKLTSSSTWLDPVTVLAQGGGFATGHYENYTYFVEQGDWQYDWWSDSWYWNDTSYYATGTRFVAGGGTVIISGSSQTPRRATLFIDVASGTYDVRVIRDTADSTDARLQNKTNWSTLRSYQTDSLVYIGQNRRGLTIRASEQLNGTIQQLSVQASSHANYWNGSAWVAAQTSNPAHWFMDFAKGRFDSAGKLLYGVGLNSAQIDLVGLNAWAAFCTAENLTFNAVLDGNQTASDILTAIARCGFASPTWASGKLGVIWDARNASPVAAFGMSNIIRGSFQVSYITEQLAQEIIVQFVNPSLDWSQDQVRVLVPGVTTPTRSSTLDLLGCTNAAMAGKFANYFAAQQYYRTRRIQWDCDFEGFVCQRGDVVQLSHDLTQWGYSGRIVSISGSTLTLDRLVPRNGGVEHVMLKRPDGTMTTYSALAGSVESDTITLTSSPSIQSGVDLMDHIWFFSPLATPGKLIKILSVQPVSESRVTVIATDEDPAFYAAWDGSWASAPSSTLLLNSKPIVSNVAFQESLYRKNTGIFSRVAVSFTVSGSYDHANVRWRIGSGAWSKGSTYSSSYEFDTPDIGTLEIEIIPISMTLVGDAVLASSPIYGVSLPPADVGTFTIANNAVAWGAVDDVDVIGYEIKWNSAGSLDWSSSQALHSGYLTSSPWPLPYTISGGALLIKAVDVVGNRSVSPASIVLPTTSTVVGNIYATQAFGSLGWPGDITGGTMTPGGLVADALDPVFWSADTDQFWGGDTDQFWQYGYSQLTYLCRYVPTDIGRPINLTVAAELVGTGSIQYRRVGSSSAWMMWPGSIVAETGGYDFLITVASGQVQGRINAFSIYVSTTPTILYFNDQVISSSGTRLPIGASWNGILGVKMTVQSDGHGATSAVTIDKSLSGPLVNCYNPAGTQVQGLIDAEVRVY